MKSKLFLLLSVTCLAIVSLFTSAYGQTYKYTVSGVVTSISGDQNAVQAAELLISVGDPVQYTFEVDFDGTATATRYNGQVLTWNDYVGTSDAPDYFYTTYIGGSDVGPLENISSPDPNLISEWHHGLNNTRFEDGVDVQHTGYLSGGDSYNLVRIENYSQHVQDWKVGEEGLGTLFQVLNEVRNSNSESAKIRSNVILEYTDNPANPVSIVDPEEAVGQLITQVVKLNLHSGIINSLDSKLEAALNALDDLNENNDVAAINSLYAFIKYVEAQRGKSISEENANALIESAEAVILSLQEGA